MPNITDEHGAPNNRSNDSLFNNSSSALQNYTMQVEVMRLSKITVIEVDKRRLDKIKSKTDDTLSILSRTALKKEIYLGIATTCLGAFIGAVPDLVKMVLESKYDITFLCDVIMLLIAVGFFFAFRSQKHISDVSPLIKDIDSELDAIVNSITNIIHENSTLNDKQ